MTRIVEGLNPSISTPHEFYDVFQSIPIPLNNLLYELYLDNLIVPNDIEWNSLLYIGDVLLRAVMSWMLNEISREHQAAPYRENKMIVPLLMRLEVQNSRRSFLDWISILDNPSRAHKVCSVREQAFVD